MTPRIWLGWSASAVGVALLGGAQALLLYQAGPAPAMALPAAAAVVAAAIWRPMYGVYLAILAVPLEVLDLRFGGDAGLSPAEGLLLLSAAAGLPRLLRRQARAPAAPHLWFAGFLVLASLGIFFAEDAFTVGKIVVIWSAFLAVSIFVASGSREELERVLACVAVAGGALGLVAILGTGEQELQSGGTVASNRAEGTFTHPNVLAFNLLLAIPAALVLALEARRPAIRVICLVAAGLAIAGLMLTLSRGGLVGGVISLLVLLAWPRFRRYAFALLTVLALFALFNLNSLQDTSTVSLVGKRIATLATSEGQQGGRRLDIWSDTPRMVIDRPFLGVGEGNYPNVSPDYGIRDIGGLPFDHAHNIALTIVAETGLIGLLLFGGFAVAVGRMGAQALRGRRPGIYPPALAVVAALTGLLVTSIGEYPPRTNVVMALILIEVGVLAGYNRLRREEVGGGHIL